MKRDGSQPRRWVIGDAVLDEAAFELIVSGQKVKLEPKALGLLIFMLSRAGQVVTKDEMQEAVWPGRILSESVQSRLVSLIRKALKDDSNQIIKTVMGYGYRLDIPDAAPPQVKEPQPPPALVPGFVPPNRPHWKLEEKLGAGTHGEAWLARHEKTHAARVFKFARDGSALSSLRRETTLFRAARESLGERAPVVPILDWSLDTEPYFIELDFVPGRDIATWATARGGLLSLPLEDRIELVAQVADAVASLHSIGIVHKDLKPGNVLIEPASEPGLRHRIVLCDLGSGKLLDPDLLDRLKITRLGMTEQDSKAFGTLIYLAPEALEGEPITVKSEIYSLGIFLFQMIVGSFVKPLSSGWETYVPDPLLRDDIRMAIVGDPARRCGNASELATRLRTLDARREQAAAEQKARKAAAEAVIVQAQIRRWRAIVAGLAASTAVAAGGGYYAFKKGAEARAATEKATAINSFLTDDVLGVDPAIEKPSLASYESLLDRGASHIDRRFAEQPDIASRMHTLFGRRYQETGQIEKALNEFTRAVTIVEASKRRPSVDDLIARERLAHLHFGSGKTLEALGEYKQAIADCERLQGPDDFATLFLRTRSARLAMMVGRIEEAETELRKLQLTSNGVIGTPYTLALLKEWVGIALINDLSSLKEQASLAKILKAQVNGALALLQLEFTGDYDDAIALYQDAIASYSEAVGDKGDLIANHRLELSSALAIRRRFNDAEKEFQKAQSFFHDWLPASHWIHAAPTDRLAMIRLEQGRISESIRLISNAIGMCANAPCGPLASEVEFDAGLIFLQANRLSEAAASFQKSIQEHKSLQTVDPIGLLKRRAWLAEALIRQDKNIDAAQVLDSVLTEDLKRLPRQNHLILGQYQYAMGLLLMKQRDLRAAAEALGLAAEIFELRLGRAHWRTIRVREDYEKAQTTIPPAT